MCLAFTIHMTLLGEKGLRQLAAINHANACDLSDRLGAVKRVEVLNASFFNEFTIRVPGDSAKIIEKMARKGVLGGVPASRLLPKNKAVKDLILVANTEVNTDDDRAAFVAALEASI
jgi:glycine dehydrogenase subunit 1